MTEATLPADQPPSRGSGTRGAVRAWARHLVARSPFGAIVDVDAELTQLGVIRIITGLLCLTRMAPQVWSLQYYFGTDGAWYVAPHAIGGVVVLVLAGLVAAGVLTPLSTVALLITTRRYETEIASASLATDLLCLLLTMLVVTSAGARLSVDAVLVRQQRGWLGAPVRLLYRVIGVPSTRGLQAILLLFFVALALINLGGVVHHWFDDAWKDGQAMAMILSSTYMSRVWPVWRSFETSWPEAAAWTSWFITKTQLVMQTSMLALVWWRPTAWLLVFWGCTFFLGSIAALQLHYLGAFELLLWIALFHRPRVTVAQTSSSFTRPLRAEALFARTATAFLVVFVLHEGWALAGMHPYPFPTLREYIAMVGVHSPIVFNRRDQSLGDAWSVVYFGNREELLPYHGRHGERMGWTLWNDLLLYRNSVRWRGEFDPAAALDPHSRLVSRLVDLTLFDHRRRGVDVSVYVADYYIAPASDTERPAAQRFQSRYLGSTRFQCSGRNLDARCIAQTAEAPAAK